jgi:hypothetical protein
MSRPTVTLVSEGKGPSLHVEGAQRGVYRLKINYRTKINYRVRARSGRPEDEVERR